MGLLKEYLPYIIIGFISFCGWVLIHKLIDDDHWAVTVLCMIGVYESIQINCKAWCKRIDRKDEEE